ncbi:MAG: SIS domain-containing protein [Solirubrobacteraceae bacterium]
MTSLLGYTPADLRSHGADHTAREIAQQPAVWREVGRAAVTSREANDAFLRPLLDGPQLRIVLAGAGTSAFAGQVLAPVLARRLGRRVDAVATTDIVSNPRECFVEDVPTLLVSFARSGDSPESVAATRLAEQCLSQCSHLVVSCNPDGRLARDHSGKLRSRVLLIPAAANDRGFAMTSSFTGMMLAAMLALEGATNELLAEQLAVAAERVLSSRPSDAQALAARGYSRIVYLGSGALKGLARESALKALELTAGRVVALSDSALGFRHGPKAVLDERTLVVVYLSNDPYTRQYDRDIVAELRHSLPPGNIVTITARDADPLPGEGTWQLPGLDDVDDAALAVPAVLCAQLIGLQFSLALGCTPDNPFPSGEVNRVVQGVTLHPLQS